MDLISLYKCLMGGCKEDTTRAGLLVLSDRTIGSRLKLKSRKFHLDMLKKEKVGFVCIGFWLFVGFSILLLVITYWNRLLREVVKFPPQEKVAQKPSGNSTDLDTADPALSNWVGYMISRGPFLPQLFCKVI